MATKPTPGGSDGTYGTELNAFLDISLAADGKIKTEALQTDATAPSADAALANKKYVDDTPHTEGIVQLVNIQTGAESQGATALPIDDTIPQITEGDEVMTLAITPASASNKLRIDVIIVATNSGSVDMVVALFNTHSHATNALAVTVNHDGVQGIQTIPLTYYMTAPTTSETTFRVRIGGAAGITYFNQGENGGDRFGGTLNSSITITEFKV